MIYHILGVNVAVNCLASDLRALIHVHWGHLASSAFDPDLVYSVSRNETGQISIARSGQPTCLAADEGQLLFELESDACIAIQRLRPDLFFVHAAVAEIEGKACALVAESGGGKSTTLWGMLHHGWRYLSDELAPIDLSSLRVHAYPRALCLKQPPPPGYPLPRDAVVTPRTLHIPVNILPAVSQMTSCPLAAIYFVRYFPEAGAPAIRPISPAEAGARIYANSLNALAHVNAGLDAAVHLARGIPAFMLHTVELSATCELLASR